MPGKNKKGYTLVELLVVIAIIAILSAASTGIYHGYVEKAKTAKYYELAHQIRQALAICEMEYGDRYGFDETVYESDQFFLPPNDPDSILYDYVGENTSDCTDYTLKLQKEEGDEFSGIRYRIIGFVYETEDYSVRWEDPDVITVEKK